MTSFLKTILTSAMVLILSCCWGKAATSLSFGKRPPDSIFDPTDVLTFEERKEISDPLRKILKDEGIDVLIAVLPDIGDSPADHIAKALSSKWSESKINSVVICVPGNPKSPWIYPGELMVANVKPEILRETIAAAEKRAAAEPTNSKKIRAASIEAADAMRFWFGRAILRTETMINSRRAGMIAYEKRQRLLKLSAVLGAAAIIPLVAGLTLVFFRLRRNKSRTFPAVRIATRLGAPYSGGNSTLNH